MRIDIWSDVVCPWCYIGKRRLERALDEFEHADSVAIHWRSFELDPNAPAVREGEPAARLARKYGLSLEQARAASERLTALAAAEGLAYRLDATRSGNSFDAHRLLHLAEQCGLQDTLKERLFAGYFCEGQAIGDPTVLCSLATSAGLDDEEVSELLAGEAFAEEVRADEAEAAGRDITGVPFFLIDGRFGIPGAQDAGTILAVLRRRLRLMDAPGRWAELMQRAEDDVALDEAALVIAACAHPGLDVAGQLRRLDDIAASIRGKDADAVCRTLFAEIGLRGDRRAYDDPRNSYLDQVLDRRLGIPISLSAVLIEIGRRRGLHLEGVGMPGHFLVRDAAAPDLLIDTFDRGRRLDAPGCERLLRAVVGPGARLTAQMLAPTSTRSILARMLANLDRSFERRADRQSLGWVTDLRLRIPDLPPADRLQLGVRLSALGRFDEAADILDAVAAHPSLQNDVRSRLQAEATSLRARSN